VVAQEALKKLKGEASRLRDEAMATAKETARCHGCHGCHGTILGVKFGDFGASGQQKLICFDHF